MKVVVLYRPASEHATVTEEFVRNFRSRTYGEYDIETMNIDSREGATMASTYDVTQYPAILVLRDDGSMQQFWQGTAFPLIDEVAAYAHA